jgi:Holliday junction resolvase RusA-like endonuclease
VSRELRFTAIGVAQPKGSTKAFLPKGWTRPIVTSANPKNKGWQQIVAEAASRELQRAEHVGGSFSGPVEIEVCFYLPRPKALLTKKLAPQNVPHVKKPDVDKLARSCADALKGVVWNDDSQVTDLIARKRYVAADGFARAVIVVREAHGTEGLFSTGV